VWHARKSKCHCSSAPLGRSLALLLWIREFELIKFELQGKKGLLHISDAFMGT